MTAPTSPTSIDRDLLARKCAFDRGRLDGSRWCRVHNAFQEPRRNRCPRALEATR